MKTKALRTILLLLAISLLLVACGQKELNPADYGLPADVQVIEGFDGRPWIVKQTVEKTLPITLPETEDFALISHGHGSFFGLKKHYVDYKPIVHARYGGNNGNKYYIRFFDEEWLYAPDENGTYWLYEPYGDVFKRQKTSKTEEEVKAWFFTDTSEGSMSIAMICGVWGEPTGKQLELRRYDYFKGQDDYIVCDEYDFHGILQYADPQTGIAIKTLACCDWRDKAENYADSSSAAVFLFQERFPGDNVWGQVSVMGQMPVLKD